eukprot:scaffold139_cov324-Prasinococcus_capsulatus_cf.AAC.4
MMYSSSSPPSTLGEPRACRCPGKLVRILGSYLGGRLGLVLVSMPALCRAGCGECAHPIAPSSDV